MKMSMIQTRSLRLVGIRKIVCGLIVGGKGRGTSLSQIDKWLNSRLRSLRI